MMIFDGGPWMRVSRFRLTESGCGRVRQSRTRRRYSVTPFRLSARFGSATEIFASLETAGFDVEEMRGDWDDSPLTPTSCELIVLARRR